MSNSEYPEDYLRDNGLGLKEIQVQFLPKI